jgi:hypothetical protein
MLYGAQQIMIIIMIMGETAVGHWRQNQVEHKIQSEKAVNAC